MLTLVLVMVMRGMRCGWWWAWGLLRLWCRVGTRWGWPMSKYRQVGIDQVPQIQMRIYESSLRSIRVLRVWALWKDREISSNEVTHI